MSEKDLQFWCVRCGRCYSSKQKFYQHFENKSIQGDGDPRSTGGRFFPNTCFGSTLREYAHTSKEADMIKRQSQKRSIDKFFPVSKKQTAGKNDTINKEITQIIEEEQASSSSSIDMEPLSVDFVKNHSETVSDQFSVPAQSVSVESDKIVERLDALKKDTEQILQSFKDLSLAKEEKKKYVTDLLTEKNKYIKEHALPSLINARSMKNLLENPLVHNIFQLVPHQVNDKTTFDESGEFDEHQVVGHCYLVCQICEATSKSGIIVEDKDYDCRFYQVMEPWFSQTKQSIKIHLDHPSHNANKSRYDKKIVDNNEALENIKKSLRYLVYYVIRSNIAFISFPPLLATVFQCGLEVGDINHTDRFVSRILPLIDTILLENTKIWLSDQSKISISLDIGTILGLVLLVVYFIGEDGKPRLAGCDLTEKKEGDHLARLCYKISCSNIYAEEYLIQQKTNAIVADGAFVDGNTPFKQEICNLFRNPTMVFRWDPFHMFNRAHIAARGLTNVDLSTLDDARQQAVTAQRTSRPLVSKMMDYVQSESKTWRSGIRYTQLVMETLDFMRPKIFSSTRMSLYEYDQIKRFIEVSHYFDVPWEYDVMSKLYCLIMFVERLILKTCQKTEDIRHFISRVFLGINLNEPEGKTAMKLALRVGKDIIRGQSISYLDTGNFVDVISSNARQNIFVQELKKLVSDLGTKLVPISLVPTGRNRQANISLTSIETSLEHFIEKLWNEFQNRTARTDLTSVDCSCFSEAPCESFFSKWGNIVETRPSLTVENIVRLIRIQLEGPYPGTDDAHKLMKTAMEHYLTISHLGERYCTQRWVPGRVSTTVTKVMNRPWQFSIYS